MRLMSNHGAALSVYVRVPFDEGAQPTREPYLIRDAILAKAASSSSDKTRSKLRPESFPASSGETRATRLSLGRRGAAPLDTTQTISP